ncbi:MAG TPA: hypothetical protein VH396_11005 [Chitinophagaceae bacterium]|jgi:inosine/xanthosine triphosphate pyrophosphatase family protein
MSNNSEKIREVLIESAKIQVAAMNAGIEFWKNWVNQASEYSRDLSDQLFNITKNNIDQDAVIGNLTDSSLKFVREMSTLPGVYSKHFEQELSKMSGTAKGSKPSRRAKAKD